MGNFSRNTFNKLKHYVGVRLQQGVPIVDADWNELEDIRRYELQAFLKWFVGNGVPKGNDGFRILPVAAGNDFTIKGGDGTADGAGRCLVEGWDVINERNLNYKAQRLFNNAALAAKWGVHSLPPLTTPGADRTDKVFLDLWEREVGAEEDTYLVNPAIGIETCVRRKREWVVRVAEGVSPPPLFPGHAFYPLASLSRKRGEAVISADAITDLRQTGINTASLEAEIADARGMKDSLGKRLDESLTKGGKLKPNVVENDQIKDKGVGTTKLGDRAVTAPTIADGAITNIKVADNSLFLSKLSGKFFSNQVIVGGGATVTAHIGFLDAFQLVSVSVVDGGIDRSVNWSLVAAAWLPSGSPAGSPLVRVTYVVLKNTKDLPVVVNLRAYVFAEPVLGVRELKRIVIVYDQSGQIVNVAKVYHLPEDIPHPFGNLRELDRVLYIDEPQGELREMDLLDIQSRFSVDVATQKLIQRKDQYL